MRRQSGMTLIEVAIASLLMLVIALGVLPIFMRASSQNVSAEIYTELANHARARAEEYRQLPFNSAELTLEPLAMPGNCTLQDDANGNPDSEKVCTDYFSRAQQQWKTLNVGQAPPATDPAEWLRTTTIRQYNLLAYLAADAAGNVPAPLPSSATANTVQLKEVQVDIENPRLGGWADFGGGRILTVRAQKSH